MGLAAAANPDCPACRRDVWPGGSYFAEHHAESTCRARNDGSYFRRGAAGSSLADLDCRSTGATGSHSASYCSSWRACRRGNSLCAQLATPERIHPAHLNRCTGERCTALRHLNAPTNAAGGSGKYPALAHWLAQWPGLGTSGSNATMGKITALVGPNGSGKSTLLKALARIAPPRAGMVYLDGRAITRMSTREVALHLAILPQGPSAPEELTVAELVEQGRYPHAGPLRMLREQDHVAIQEALDQTNMEQFRHRRLDSLSGGERQRAWIALALAQATPVLLLDEPTTFLDVWHQIEVLDLVRTLNRTHGKTIVLVVHDLNMAARYADRMVVLQNGRIVADGAPREVLTASLLADVFQVQAYILSHPVDGLPVCLPYGILK